jgi:hypothetical protein
MNWGKGIALVIILFMGFIVSFVVRAFNNETDLVREDYYQAEVNYDDNIKSKNNYFALKEKVKISKTERGIEVLFPSIFSADIKGSINFYRPQSKALDKSYRLDLNASNLQILSYSDFVEGFYEITIDWTSGSTSYIFEDEIVF